jgi:hypothetical protein
MSLHKGEPKPAIETAIVAAVLLTPQQLAERLAVPKSWVREKCRVRAQLHDSDPLPIVALGCYTRFDWNAVQAWLVRQAMLPPKPPRAYRRRKPRKARAKSAGASSVS